MSLLKELRDMFGSGGYKHLAPTERNDGRSQLLFNSQFSI